MKYTLVVSDDALLDIEDAKYWYENQKSGLGERLLISIFESFSVIETNPLLVTKRYRDVRVKFIKHFPFGIHYIISGNEIKIIAFFHMRRDPKRWNKDKLL